MLRRLVAEGCSRNSCDGNQTAVTQGHAVAAPTGGGESELAHLTSWPTRSRTVKDATAANSAAPREHAIAVPNGGEEPDDVALEYGETI